MDGDDKVADSVTVRADALVVSEGHKKEVQVEVLEALVALGGDRALAPDEVLEAVAVWVAATVPAEVPAVSEEGRDAILVEVPT